MSETCHNISCSPKRLKRPWDLRSLLFNGYRRPERKSDYLPPSVVEVKNECTAGTTLPVITLKATSKRKKKKRNKMNKGIKKEKKETERWVVK
jgi:hypothetical protein